MLIKLALPEILEFPATHVRKKVLDIFIRGFDEGFSQSAVNHDQPAGRR
jgi:hypothetical protein